MRHWMLLGLLLWQPFSALADTPELLLILDDIGYSRALGERAVALPGPLNLAFLPFTPHAVHLANEAAAKGHGIMLHAPMANERGNRLGPGGLMPEMDRITLQQTLADDINAVPHVQGLNNHMGSLLTQKPEAMQWVMEVARQQGLFFVDSLTSGRSVALKKASEAGIPSLERDVFLDNDTTDAALQQQYNKALRLAHKQGYAVLIGHPYPQTLDFLARELPLLAQQGIRLNRIDQHLQQQLWSRMASPEPPPMSRYLLNPLLPHPSQPTAQQPVAQQPTATQPMAQQAQARP